LPTHDVAADRTKFASAVPEQQQYFKRITEVMVISLASADAVQLQARGRQD
jgi:hypothetical protein